MTEKIGLTYSEKLSIDKTKAFTDHLIKQRIRLTNLIDDFEALGCVYDFSDELKEKFIDKSAFVCDELENMVKRFAKPLQYIAQELILLEHLLEQAKKKAIND